MRRVNDPDGEYMIHVSDEYATRALARGELTQDEHGHLAVVPKPMNVLTEDVKRRIRLANERKNK